MLIGLELAGSFGAAPGWTLETIKAVAIRADMAGIDFILVPDRIAGLDGHGAWPDATILLGWLAAATQRIGLIVTTATGGHQPYNLSRRIASLDQISHGRIGWCVTTAGEEEEAAAFSGPHRLPGGSSPARITEFVEVVEGLWHGWDADAMVIDKQGGQFIDPAKMHALDHHGHAFSVRGPLNVMRSPQNRPILAVQAEDLAALPAVAALADLVFFEGDTPPVAAKRLRRIQAAALPEQSPGADGILLRITTPATADSVLSTPRLTEWSSTQGATTLRERLQGEAR